MGSDWRRSTVPCVRVGMKHIIYKWCEAHLQGLSLAAVGVQKMLQQQRRTYIQTEKKVNKWQGPALGARS